MGIQDQGRPICPPPGPLHLFSLSSTSPLSLLHFLSLSLLYPPTDRGVFLWLPNRGGQIFPPPHLSHLRRGRRWPKGVGSFRGGRSPPSFSLNSLSIQPPSHRGGFLKLSAGEDRSALPLVPSASGGGEGGRIDRSRPIPPPSLSFSRVAYKGQEAYLRGGGR